jgi:hypothetical protein
MQKNFPWKKLNRGDSGVHYELEPRSGPNVDPEVSRTALCHVSPSVLTDRLGIRQTDFHEI